MKRFVIPTVLLLVLFAAGAFSGCGQNNDESTPAGEKVEAPAVTVNVTTLETEAFNEIIDVTGSIASYEDVMVPSDEGGRVLKWTVPLGARVRAGQVLVQLDSAIVRATYDAAVAQYQITQTSYQRQKNVFEEQGISELQLKTLQYQRDAARAQMDIAQARLERTRIKSPINGILNARLIETGEMSAPGLPVAHVVNTDRLKIVAGIPERYANSFRVGDHVSFSVDALPAEDFGGSIRFVGAAVNPDNRSIPVEVDVKVHGGRLKPDMIARMHVTLSAKTKSIVIAEDYVNRTDRDEFVAYVEEDGIARERKLRIGATSRGRVLVLEGLDAGDRLITFGYQNVAEGQRIVVKN